MNKRLDDKMLLQLVKKVLLVVITLFSVVIFKVNAEAGHVKYSYDEFDWETFLEQRDFWWSDKCNTEEDISSDECVKIFKSEEEFYTRLYKILAKMDDEGYSIIDEIILQVVFYGMTPEAMNDDGQLYLEYKKGIVPYNMDQEDEKTNPKVDIIVEPSKSIWDAIIDLIGSIFKTKNDGGYEGYYYHDETDSLKALVQNMITYKTTCYEEYGEAKKVYTTPTEYYWDCSEFEGTSYKNIKMSLFDRLFNNNRASDLHGKNGDMCVIEHNYTMGYYKYFSSKWEHQWYPLGGFDDAAADWYGEVPVDEGYEQCKEMDEALVEGGGIGTVYEYLEDDDTHEVSTDVFFDFLKYSKYFDRKQHLLFYFDDVLRDANVDCLVEEQCDNSLEAQGFDAYQDHINDIREDRLHIIEAIIQNLNALGYDIDYSGLDDGKFIPEKELQEAERKSNYWPIGSNDTEIRNGITFADGEPASTEVIKDFNNNGVNNHFGIDIKGENGVTNVISVSDGEVITVVSDCEEGDKTCNDGYGNQIIIAAENGDYIVYGHMSDIMVSVGDNVLKGQLIGHVGKTGDCDQACLHWEIRVGGNDQEHAINPYQSVSPSNPRPTDITGDFDIHSTTLTKEEFISKLVTYCNTHSCKDDMIKYFVNQAGLVYDLCLKYNLNPEFVIVRAMGEGFSPGGTTYNFWGIGCVNSDPTNSCYDYDSFEEGISGLANMKIVKNAKTAGDAMNNGYAYIGDYWWQVYNKKGKKNWSPGGCVWLPYISKYMSSGRYNTVKSYCDIDNCPYEDKGTVGSCLRTTDEDQKAYVSYLTVDSMATYRRNVFGL